MGVASYRRGNAEISHQFALDRYAADPFFHRDPKNDFFVEPRPAGWGNPTAERARIEAEKIAARNLEKPESALDRPWAVHFVMERARCGKRAAEAAVDAVRL